MVELEPVVFPLVFFHCSLVRVSCRIIHASKKSSIHNTVRVGLTTVLTCSLYNHIVSLIVNMIMSRKAKIITLSICSLLFHPIKRYAVFFRLVVVFNHISLISEPITTICNHSIPDHKNQILLASTASSSWRRKKGNKTISKISAQMYPRKICCSLLRCIHQRSTISIRRFIEEGKMINYIG